MSDSSNNAPPTLEQLAERQAANVVAKVNEGKVLTKREEEIYRAFLETTKQPGPASQSSDIVSFPEKPPRGWQVNYANHFGCTRAYICRKIKEGLPFHRADPKGGFSEADRWMNANAKEGVKHKSKGSAAITAAPDSATPAVDSAPLVKEIKSIDISKLTGESIESALERAKYAERISFAALQRILSDTTKEREPGESLPESIERRVKAAAVLPGLRRNHAAAATAYVQIEKRLAEYKQETGALVQAGAYRDILEARLNPISSRLDGLPEAAAHRVNPNNPHHARQELRKVVGSMRKEIDAAYQKSITQKRNT